MSLPPHRHGAWPAVGPSYNAADGRAVSTSGRSGYHGSQRGPPLRGGRSFSERNFHQQPNTEAVQGGRLVCGYVPEAKSSATTPCEFQTNSDLALMLHKADRHLVYPPGGKEEVDRRDPLLLEERKEANRRTKRQQHGGRLEQEEAKALNTIPGLNIALSTPELVDQWIAERKKRWPSDKVLQQKVKDGWSGSHTTQQNQDRPISQTYAGQHNKNRDVTAVNQEAPPPKIARKGEPSHAPLRPNREVGDDALSEIGSSIDSGSEDDSSSDAPSEEPIGKIAETARSVEEIRNHATSSTATPVCRYFLEGRCNYGDLCRQSHSQSPGAQKPQISSQIPPSRRPRPRNPVQNPFEPKNLLHALLKHDIGQHVDAVAQVIRFLVRNEYLTHVELQPGLAEAQQKKRNRIQDVSSAPDEAPESIALPVPRQLSQPLKDGALPIASDGMENSASRRPTRSLYQPSSPPLRPLKQLAWPPEPDPMLFLDPMRRNDPKPLTGKQFELLATDRELRSLLCPITDQHPHGERRVALERALRTLDDLPTEGHRRSALELILGVSAQTPQHAHQLGPTFVQPKPGEARFIGEVELFKLGLRCGPEEQSLIQRLAQRISEVTEGPEFDAEPLGWDHQREEGISFREEKRRRYYEREADRRDLLRKLGIDVD